MVTVGVDIRSLSLRSLSLAPYVRLLSGTRVRIRHSPCNAPSVPCSLRRRGRWHRVDRRVVPGNRARGHIGPCRSRRGTYQLHGISRFSRSCSIPFRVWRRNVIGPWLMPSAGERGACRHCKLAYGHATGTETCEKVLKQIARRRSFGYRHIGDQMSDDGLMAVCSCAALSEDKERCLC